MTYEQVLRILPALNEITTVEDINYVYKVTTSQGAPVPNALLSFYVTMSGSTYLLHTGATNVDGVANYVYRLMDFAAGVHPSEYIAFAQLQGCFANEYSDGCTVPSLDQAASIDTLVRLQSDAPNTCIDGEVMQEVTCPDGFNTIYQKVCIGGYWKDSGLKCPESSNPMDNSGILPIALAIAVGIAAWAAYATKR
jgi:hypothetical protein